jgi:hypothetical protein
MAEGCFLVSVLDKFHGAVFGSDGPYDRDVLVAARVVG